MKLPLPPNTYDPKTGRTRACDDGHILNPNNPLDVQTYNPVTGLRWRESPRTDRTTFEARFGSHVSGQRFPSSSHPSVR